MQKAVKKSNIEKKNRKLTNHSGRKTTATRLLDEGIPITCIQQHTGHKFVESISNYGKKQLKDPTKNVCYFIKIKSCSNQ
jgi:integrase